MLLLRPIPVAAQSKARMVLDRCNTGIVGSNLTRDLDICPCYRVWVESLRLADPLSK